MVICSKYFEVDSWIVCFRGKDRMVAGSTLWSDPFSRPLVSLGAPGTMLPVIAVAGTLQPGPSSLGMGS